MCDEVARTCTQAPPPAPLGMDSKVGSMLQPQVRHPTT